MTVREPARRQWSNGDTERLVGCDSASVSREREALLDVTPAKRMPRHSADAPGEPLSLTVTLPNEQRIEIPETVVRWSGEGQSLRWRPWRRDDALSLA